jgi:3-deoxy-D-manno-octulosonate 8-phosphate phosphatase (KDO 8-P phosphatase)
MTQDPPFSPALLLRAQGQGLGMRCAFFDVDGVLTDGRIYVGEQGETFKAFSTLDGQGLKLLVQAGITPVIITGRDTPAVRRRVAELGLAHAHYGVHDKLAVARAVLKQMGLGWADAAAMGDDWPDLPLLRNAGFACVPANAHREAKALAHHVTATRGGHGAAREFCDILLMACGAYARLLRAQTSTLDDGGVG